MPFSDVELLGLLPEGGLEDGWWSSLLTPSLCFLQVRAHFSAIAPTPCPSLLGLCASAEDCVVHSTSLPFNGFKPDPGWCVRQWQKTVPSNYSGSITLGYDTNL